MRRVLAALPAELAHLQPVRRRFPVLGRRVIPVLALGALQLNNFPRHSELPPNLCGTAAPGCAGY